MLLPISAQDEDLGLGLQSRTVIVVECIYEPIGLKCVSLVIKESTVGSFAVDEDHQHGQFRFILKRTDILKLWCKGET